jgi:hypothetical protein
VGFGLDTGFIQHLHCLQYWITIQKGTIPSAQLQLSWQYRYLTINGIQLTTTCAWSSRSAVPHQPSDIGFQRGPSPSRLVELSPSHIHNDSQCTLQLEILIFSRSELFAALQITD